jgi:hypothetical protein
MNIRKFKMEDVVKAAQRGNGEIYAELKDERVQGSLLGWRPLQVAAGKNQGVFFIRADDVWVREINLADVQAMGPVPL